MALNRVIVAGTSIVQASDINGIQAAWDTYVPVATNFTVGNGSISGRWIRVGKSVLIRIFFQAGSTTTYTAGQMTISLPAAAHGTSSQVLTLRLASTSGQFVNCCGDVNAGASTVLLAAPATATTVALSAMSSASVNPGTTGNIVLEGILELA